MATLGPSIWAVSDGRAGNAAQVRALTQALGATHRWMRIAHIAGEGHRQAPLVFTPKAPWRWLPADRWPSTLSALPKDQRAQLAPPWPTLWIAAGRRSAALTKYARRASDGKTFTVQILDPYIAPSNFDLLVVPEHDAVDGPNVIRTVGSPAYFAPEMLEDAAQNFANLADETQRSAIVILGGDSRVHSFTQAAADRLEDQLRGLAAEGWRLRLTASRRTPVPIAARFRQMAGDIGSAFWAGPQDGPNPYLAWLLFSNAAIVTEDSANMLSDAAWHGLPVHIARLDGRAEKFDRLHESLIDRGIARWFTGKLDQWTYEPLREADRVADLIVEKLLERYPAPDFGSSFVTPDWMRD
ncbi:mitochondrial fission ELM1 family protein [Hyphomonas sp. WL0036]|uniref:mitochondrial fission ELM1 family protein n=1 Tax=Hyphomonas sediminis TaxID=2866160 RepID=UPI001C806CFB|nr:mitochondrial fission ELM1 family protein [Hyphomonas sediminis]MBY9065399.1 mitochondrial fission ELM1 family protein [Hyphomonas sediminis]